ncbi:transcription initiation factor TFIID subunit 4-like [Manis pentadactyla]|uniref:transcription initiation factor TFIID subunit 4-like n=1 Tax=Manis pentadactyla TaxID=143292 RepID=UPI00255CBA97|nr:transcription initiation factor TFIID subunit 4-like [Manis pentadactyla]
MRWTQARRHSPSRVSRQALGGAAVAGSDPAPPGGTAGTAAAGRARAGCGQAAGRGDTHLGRTGRTCRPAGRRPHPPAAARAHPPRAQRDVAGRAGEGAARRPGPPGAPAPAPGRRAAPGGGGGRARRPTWEGALRARRGDPRRRGAASRAAGPEPPSPGPSRPRSHGSARKCEAEAEAARAANGGGREGWAQRREAGPGRAAGPLSGRRGCSPPSARRSPDSGPAEASPAACRERRGATRRAGLWAVEPRLQSQWPPGLTHRKRSTNICGMNEFNHYLSIHQLSNLSQAEA